MDTPEQVFLANVRKMRAMGAPPEDVKAYIEEARAELAAARAPQSEGGTANKLAGAARSLAQGATFNFADEGEAAIRSLAGDQTYDEALASVRADLDTYRRENPKTALALELAGGLAPGVGLAKLTKAGVSGLSALSRLAATGAGGGALAGAGAGETPTGRVVGAGAGAVLGGTLGKLAEIGVNAVANRGASKALVRAAGKDASDGRMRWAAKRVASKLDPAEVRDNLALRGADDPLNLVTTGGEGASRLARGLRTVDAPGAKALRQDVEAIRRGQGKRLTAAVSNAVGEVPEDFALTLEQQAAKRGERASDLYGAARTAYGEMNDPAKQSAVMDAVNDPDIADFIGRVQRLREFRGKSATDFDVLDAAYKLMNDRYGDLQTALKGDAANVDRLEMKALNEMRGILRGALDTATDGAYGTALADFAGDVATERAAKAGRREVSRLLPDELGGRVRGLESAAEREAYTKGAGRNIADRIAQGQVSIPVDGRVGRDATRTLLADPEVDKLTTLVGDEKAQGVIRAALAEAQNAQAYNTMVGGSPTADKLADAMAVNPEAAASAVAAFAKSPGGLGGLLYSIRAAAPALQGLKSARGIAKQDALSELLRTSDRGTIEALLAAIEEYQRKQGAGKAIGRAASTDLIGRIGDRVGAGSGTP